MKRKPQSRRRVARAKREYFGGLRPITVRVPVAVQLSGLSRSRLYELIREKEIEAVKLGTATLVVLDSLERFLGRLINSAARTLVHGIRPVTVRVAAAVQITGISRSRLYELIRARELETVKVGRGVLIVVESLEQLVERLRNLGAPR